MKQGPQRESSRETARQRREQRERKRKIVRLAGSLAAVALVALAAAVLLTRTGDDDSLAVNEPASLDAPEFTGGPRVAVDRTVVDYGDVPYGHEVQASYRVKNVGDQLLRIENPEVKILDGC